MTSTIATTDTQIFTTHYLYAEEVVPPGRHKHRYAHTTQVTQGSALVMVHARMPVTLRAGDPPLELPADVEHEIRALEDGTILVNVAPRPAVAAAAGQAEGGVILTDNTHASPG